MLMKSIKLGYKVWIRADWWNRICNLHSHTGEVPDATENQLGARVVKDLIQGLVGKGCHLYFDNFFNSLELQEYLCIWDSTKR